MTKIAVFLAGCGVYDGAEIHESTFTLLAIERNGATYHCFAPDVDQYHVINHITGEEMNETRNVLVEAARISRGDIKPLSDFNPKDFDAVMIPGGFGAAKNFCTFAIDGPECSVNPDMEKALKAQRAAGKPIGALCISPALLAKVFGDVTVTIGQDEGTIQGIEATGSSHVKTSHCQTVVDPDAKLVTAPCYMLESTITQIADGADACVKDLLKLI